MESAQMLYEQGLSSYPRSDSSTYSEDFDIDALLDRLATSDSHILREIDQSPTFKTGYGVQEYAKRLCHDRGIPRDGGPNEDGHEPITPIADFPYKDHAALRKHLPVFELILRYFLATVSEDCKVEGREVNFKVDAGLDRDIAWHMRCRRVQRHGWIEVLPLAYGRDIGPDLHCFKAESTWRVVDVRSVREPPPRHLSMATLLDLMHHHGIGTDASASQHIRTLLSRGYAHCQKESAMGELTLEFRSTEQHDREVLGLMAERWDMPVPMEQLWRILGMSQLIIKPSVLGKALVCWLWRYAQELVLPSVRMKVEASCADIAHGYATAVMVLNQKLAEFSVRYISVATRLLVPDGVAHQEFARLLTQRVVGGEELREIAGFDLTSLPARRSSSGQNCGTIAVQGDQGIARRWPRRLADK